MSDLKKPLFYATGLIQSNYGVGFRTAQTIGSEQEAKDEAERLNMMWLGLGDTVQRDQLQLQRVKSGAFWVSPVDEFNDLTPAEVMLGKPFASRMDPVTQFQQAILDEPFQKRFARIVEQIEAPDPATVIS